MQPSNQQPWSEIDKQPGTENPTEEETAENALPSLPSQVAGQALEAGPVVPETIPSATQAPPKVIAYEIQPGIFYPPLPSFYETMPIPDPQLPAEKRQSPTANNVYAGRPAFTQSGPPGVLYPPQVSYPGQPGALAFPGVGAHKIRSRKWLWITLAILGAVLLLCGLCSWAIYALAGNDIQGAFAVPTLVDSYYQDIQQGNYTTAYTYTQINNVTQATFIQKASQQDTTLGQISSFQLSSASPNVSTSDNSSAISSYSVVVTTVRKGKSYNVHLTIQQERGNWKITSFDTI